MTVRPVEESTKNILKDVSVSMENAGYRETEAKSKEIRIQLHNRETSTSPSSSKVCRPEVCKRARLRFQQSQGTESPWHKQKTYALIGIVASFVIWIIAYVTCSSLGLV